MTSKEVKSGEETVLTCTAKKLSADAVFTWTDSTGKEVTGKTEARSGETQESKLTITPSTDTTYKCTVTSQNNNKLDKIEKTANLKVFGKFFNYTA